MNREHVISDELLAIVKMEIDKGNIFIAYNNSLYFIDKNDVFFFSKAGEAHEFSDSNISDCDKFSVIRARSLDDFMRQIPYGENLERALADPDANGLYNKDGNDFTDVLIDHFEQQHILNNKNSTPMNQENYDFLVNQLKYTGFGEDLNHQLKEKLLGNDKEFTLTYQKDYGNDQTVATLQFRRAEESNMVFFNRFNLMLKSHQHPEAIKQTFYQGKDDHKITLKEGYNLMSGRAVYKEGLTNKDKQEYNAWVQIDFKVTDNSGNFKLHPYNDKYGFDLDKSLKVHIIKEMGEEQSRQRLVESLQRGNLQSVTMTVNGSDRKLYIEAAPRFKSLNIYDESGKRLKPEDLRQSANQSEKQSTGQSEKQSKRQGQKGGSDDDGEGEPGQKKGKRKRQSIS